MNTKHWIGYLLFIGLMMGGMSLIAQQAYYAPENENWQAEAPDGSDIQHTVFLAGDGGEGIIDSLNGLFILAHHLEKASAHSSLVFLGDNIYPIGLPEKGHKKRQQSEKIIRDQLKMAEIFPGEIYFIPGNHDWDHWSKDGWEAVRRQEDYIESVPGHEKAFLPDKGCPGPVEVPINDSILMVFLDTQWWVHKHEKPYGASSPCPHQDEAALLQRLKEIAAENKQKHVLLMGHHPLYTGGNHGGFFHPLDHLFPLRVINHNLFIPLPVIGSLYPLLRKALPNPQDAFHKRTELLKEGILAAFEGHPSFIYASGHEHVLQYYHRHGHDFIGSGAVSKTDFVAGKRSGAGFNIQQQGFAKLLYLHSGEVWVEYWVVSEDSPEEGELVFRKKLIDAAGS
jgi:hypothetical protein